MTSQPGKQTITIDILHNMSRSKDYRAIKFGQLIEYNERKHFSSKTENETRRLISDFFLFFRKA